MAQNVSQFACGSPNNKLQKLAALIDLNPSQAKTEVKKLVKVKVKTVKVSKSKN